MAQVGRQVTWAGQKPRGSEGRSEAGGSHTDGGMTGALPDSHLHQVGSSLAGGAARGCPVGQGQPGADTGSVRKGRDTVGRPGPGTRRSDFPEAASDLVSPAFLAKD